MKQRHLITKIRDVKGFTMLVEFDGEDVRAIDLTKLITQRPTYRRLKDPKIFSQFEIQDGCIIWNRDISITGPTLYHMGDDTDSQSL